MATAASCSTALPASDADVPWTGKSVSPSLLRNNIHTNNGECDDSINSVVTNYFVGKDRSVGKYKVKSLLMTTLRSYKRSMLLTLLFVITASTLLTLQRAKYIINHAMLYTTATFDLPINQVRTLNHQQQNNVDVADSKNDSLTTYSFGQSYDNDDYNDDNNNINDRLPPWLKEYAQWHAQELRNLTVQNWQTDKRKYLIARCLARDYVCGGTSDRLASLPFMLLLAYRYKRLLFIYWQRPAPLQEYLVPPINNNNNNNTTTTTTYVIDWRLPDWMEKQEAFVNHCNEADPQIVFTHQADTALQHWRNRKAMIVSMRHQSHDHGLEYYDKYAQEQNRKLQQQQQHNPTTINLVYDYYNSNTVNNSLVSPSTRGHPRHHYTFDEAYHAIWRMAFTPSPRVARKIYKAMEKLHLQPNNYVAVHMRLQYTRNKENDLGHIYNAVRCASNVYNYNNNNNTEKVPIYVAADSPKAIKQALQYGRTKFNATMAARLPDNDKNNNGDEATTLHIDRSSFLHRGDTNWTSRDASVYDSVFVDLYLLASSKCITYGVGGYGRWSSLVSPMLMSSTSNGNDTINEMNKCRIIHHDKEPCEWKWSRNP